MPTPNIYSYLQLLCVVVAIEKFLLLRNFSGSIINYCSFAIVTTLITHRQHIANRFKPDPI